MLSEIKLSNKKKETMFVSHLDFKFQSYFGKNIFLGNQKLKVYLSSWDKDDKISLTYTPSLGQKNWNSGFFKSGFSFYDCFENQLLPLLKKKKYVFVPKSLKVIQHSMNVSLPTYDFLYGEAFNANILKNYTNKLKSLSRSWTRSKNKSLIKKIQQHLVPVHLYKRYFFLYLYQKNFHLSYFNFLNKYLHLFTKTNSNLCVYSKYNQNPNLIIHQKTSEEEKQNNILKILSKTQKILTLQLKKYTNSFFSKILRQKNFKILFIRKQSFKSLKIIIKKKVQKDLFVLSLQQIYPKKHMNITHQTTEHPLYYNLLKVCLFVFPQFSHNETVYKLK